MKYYSPVLLVCGLLLSAATALASNTDPETLPFVVTQLPAGKHYGRQAPLAEGMLDVDYMKQSRIVLVTGGRKQVLTTGFYSACDPDISFDGKAMLFAGKKAEGDHWNIYEMQLDTRAVRQITHDIGDCRHPLYEGTMYKIVAQAPWNQITFVGNRDAVLNEAAQVQETDLYSCKFDGSDVERLTYNPSSDMDPVILPDGRILYSAWEKGSFRYGLRGRIALMAVDTDGNDCSLFSGDEGPRIKRMPCVTTGRLVVFVEGDRDQWDGAGSLGSVTLRRNLHSYRAITRPDEGLFYSPSPLPDGAILVSRRPAKGKGTHAVYRMDPVAGTSELLFDDPHYHDIQAKAVARRPQPDGRSSVVRTDDPDGILYCLNVFVSRHDHDGWLPKDVPTRIRVLEGVPDKIPQEVHSGTSGKRLPIAAAHGIPALLQKRFLGEVPIEDDGSFNIKVPASTPIQLQLLDKDGMALETSEWIWARNHEARGCIGCHEDGELTPDNVFVKALTHPSIPLDLPPERRRTVDFRRDVMPIISNKCATPACHGGGVEPRLDGGMDHRGRSGFDRAYTNLLAGVGEGEGYGKYVHPGRARTSPLIWHLFGRNTSRPWDGKAIEAKVAAMPPAGSAALTEDEKQTFVEWIDLGALWDGVPGDDQWSSTQRTTSGGKQ